LCLHWFAEEDVEEDGIREHQEDGIREHQWWWRLFKCAGGGGDAARIGWRGRIWLKALG
jgi:hypothetical protein